MSIKEAQELAKNEGVSDDKIQYIVGDDDTVDEAGEAAKEDRAPERLRAQHHEAGEVHRPRR